MPNLYEIWFLIMQGDPWRSRSLKTCHQYYIYDRTWIVDGVLIMSPAKDGQLQQFISILCRYPETYLDDIIEDDEDEFLQKENRCTSTYRHPY